MPKFGIDQVNKPAPAWMERMVNAMIIVVMPSVATFILSIPDSIMTPDTKNFLGAAATFGMAMLKALLYLFGETPKTHEK